MFAAPPVIETEVFARLPDEFRKKRSNSWTEANKGGAIDAFLDADLVHRRAGIGGAVRRRPDVDVLVASE